MPEIISEQGARAIVRDLRLSEPCACPLFYLRRERKEEADGVVDWPVVLERKLSYVLDLWAPCRYQIRITDCPFDHV